MSESPTGAVIAVVGMLGACSLCALGPAFLVSATAGVSAWLSGLSPMASTGLALLAAAALFRAWQAWGRRDEKRAKTDAQSAQ
jgi:hypothetical protein